MAVDTPARIAVLGAGPIGLEAALYGRFLGYDVDVYERDEVAANVLRWGHVALFTPMGMNRSPLGVAALAAQDPAWRPLPDDAVVTGRQLVETYLRPLAKSDLLIDGLHTGVEVLRIGRETLLKGECVGAEERADEPFRLLLRNRDGAERVATADVVIDATGTFHQPNWFGAGGVPALGEMGLASQVEHHLPDVLGAARDHYAGENVLVIGSGYSAATNIVALAQLAEESPGTRVTWITRCADPASAESPIRRFANDRLPRRDQLAEQANALAQAGAPVTYWHGTQVHRISRQADGRLELELTGEHAGRHAFSRVIANVGYRPDNRLYEELQTHECYATSGPMRLAAALAGGPASDCLDQASHGGQSLVTTEPNFYVLGSKSYGRRSDFLLSIGREQIRDLFKIIVDREGLDLYATVPTPSFSP